MRNVMVMVALLGLPSSAVAQSPTANDAERAAVLRVVEQLFDGMRKHDSALVRGAFAPGARLAGVQMREGQPVLTFTSVDDFANAVARSAGQDPWNEPIYNPEVRIEGRLATVWTWYDFLVGTRWSHCGVDAFQLAKLADGWKITQLTDTRQREGCTTPAAPKP